MRLGVFDTIRQEIADEYAQPHAKPWIVGFSGGKDSTLVAHLWWSISFRFRVVMAATNVGSAPRHAIGRSSPNHRRLARRALRAWVAWSSR